MTDKKSPAVQQDRVSYESVHGRTLGGGIRALLQVRHYRSAITAVAIVRRPFFFLARYALGRGRYPATVEIRTPIGVVPLIVKSWHDLRTIHEIFCAGDYRAKPSDKVIVDYGSNIGISAAYFLSRNTDSFVYLFEPLPANIQTLKANLRQFIGRYVLAEVAVGLEDGKLEFGWEPTGRYGGLGQKTGNYIIVDVRKSKNILNEVIGMHGNIDILKIDIETLEKEITEDIPPEIAGKLGTIYVEYRFNANPIAATHDMSISETISRFVRREAAKRL